MTLQQQQANNPFVQKLILLDPFLNLSSLITMQYPRDGASSSSGVSAAYGSAGSSPDFPGYDSAEYGDSPPYTTNRRSTARSHLPPIALKTSYATVLILSGMPYHPSRPGFPCFDGPTIQSFKVGPSRLTKPTARPIFPSKVANPR
jgi:hypothetical protein